MINRELEGRGQKKERIMRRGKMGETDLGRESPREGDRGGKGSRAEGE